MKLTPYLLSFGVLIALVGCTSKRRLSDVWRISTALIGRAANGEVLIVHPNSPDKSRRDMENFFSAKYKEEGGFEPNSERYEQLLSALRRARLKFVDSQRFVTESYGTIIPSATLGWHFGDTVSGAWRKEAGVLYLTVGESTSYSFKYRIIEESSSLLKLSEILGYDQEGAEYTLVRE